VSQPLIASHGVQSGAANARCTLGQSRVRLSGLNAHQLC